MEQAGDVPVIGFVSGRSAKASVRQAAAFRKGLNETGTIEGQNVLVDITGSMASTTACRPS